MLLYDSFSAARECAISLAVARSTKIKVLEISTKRIGLVYGVALHTEEFSVGRVLGVVNPLGEYCDSPC